MCNNQICNSCAVNYTFTRSPSSFMDVIQLHVPLVKVACRARNVGASPCNVFVHFAAVKFNLFSCLSIRPADKMRCFNERWNTKDRAGNLHCLFPVNCTSVICKFVLKYFIELGE